jgi:hypothetical protein
LNVALVKMIEYPGEYIGVVLVVHVHTHVVAERGHKLGGVAPVAFARSVILAPKDTVNEHLDDLQGDAHPHGKTFHFQAPLSGVTKVVHSFERSERANW